MRRLAPSLAGFAAVVGVLSLLSGGGGGSIYLIVLAGAAGLGAARLAGRTRRAGDAGWPSPAVAVPFAADRPPASPAAVALALGRVEARELASSGSFGIGIGFGLVVVVLFGFVWSQDYRGDLVRFSELQPIFVHPLVGMAVIGAHRARTRSRREGTDELFDTCPTSPTTRTQGHLASAWVAALGAVLTASGVLVAVVVHSDLTFGSIGARQVANLVGVAVLGAGGVALGVAVARWAPWSLAAVATVVAVGVASIELAGAGASTTEPLRQLSTWFGDPEVDIRYTAPHWVAHWLWLVALTGLVVALALGRDRRTRAVVGGGLACAVVAAFAGVAATRPIDAGDARRIASLVAAPERHQTCAAAGALEVCAFRSDASLAERYARELGPVVAAVPSRALDGWRIQQGSDLDRSRLDPEVQALLPPPVESASLVPVVMAINDSSYEAARFWTALAAVAVLDEHRPGLPVGLQGQARGVVALWVATRGVDDDQARRMTSFDPHPAEGEPAHRPWPDPCESEAAPVRWAITDVEAARALLSVPEADVAALLAARWDHFVDPATPTDQLLAAVGLVPLGEPFGQTRVEDC